MAMKVSDGEICGSFPMVLGHEKEEIRKEKTSEIVQRLFSEAKFTDRFPYISNFFGNNKGLYYENIKQGVD